MSRGVSPATRRHAKPVVLDARGAPMSDTGLLRDASRAARAWLVERAKGPVARHAATGALTPRERPLSSLSVAAQAPLWREWYGESTGD